MFLFAEVKRGPTNKTHLSRSCKNYHFYDQSEIKYPYFAYKRGITRYFFKDFPKFVHVVHLSNFDNYKASYKEVRSFLFQIFRSKYFPKLLFLMNF